MLGKSWGILNKLFTAGLIVLSACTVKMRREDYLARSPGAKVDLSKIPSLLRGGEVLPIQLSTSKGGAAIVSQRLEYSTDGVTYSEIAQVSDGASVYYWTVPSGDLSDVKLRYTVKDQNNKTTVVTSNAFGIDSTPPAPPPISLASAALTSSLSSSFTVNDCDDRYRVLINQGAVPTLSTAGWVNCSTAASLLSISNSVEGAQSFSVWAMDEVGNISTTATTTPSVTRDTTPPSVSLTAPAGGAYLASGASTNITWTASDLHLQANPIQLEYSLNGGTTWTTIASNLSNSGTYSWTVPAADSSNALVRVTAVDQVGLSTSSTSSSFVIDQSAPVVVVTAPNGGELISGGSTYPITWTATDSNLIATPISLSYSSDGGSTWTSIATGLANSGSYSWTVPALDLATVKVRVTAIDQTGLSGSDDSNANFTIDSTNPSISLSSFTGGGVVAGGSSAAITWTASDAHFGATPIQIEYSVNSGSTWTTIVSSQSNSGTYTWSIPSIDTTTARVRVKAMDQVGRISSSSSTSDFAIDSTPPTLSLTSLTGGQYIKGGVNNTITWSGSDLHASANPISLSYSTDGGSTWTSIATGLSNTGTYTWATPSINSSTVKVKVTMVDSVNNTSSDQSVSNFIVDSIAPSISLSTLSGPYRGGQVVSVGFTMTETNAASSQSITIEKSSDNGSTWATLATLSAANGPLSSQAFSTNWTVDSWNTTTAKVRVTYTDLAGWSTTTTSPAFTVDSTGPLIHSTSIATTAMKGGTNRSMIFKFSDSGGSGLAPNAELATSVDGTTYTVESSTILTDGTYDAGYNWTAPLANTSNFYIRIRAFDLSGNVTTYTYPSFIVDSTPPAMVWTGSPANGQAYRGGSTLNLGFTVSDLLTSVASLKVQYASDGVTFSDVTTLATNAVSYAWSIPTQNTSTAKLRLVSVDGVGNTDTLDTFNFVIDSTPPAAPVVTLFSASPTNSQNIQLTISDCTDRPYVLVNEGSQPTLASATWVPCTTAAGGISYAISNTQGTHTVKVWSQDAVGNISTSSGNVNVVYDSVAPSIVLGAIPDPNAWDAQVTLNWTVTEATISNAQSFKVEASPDGGSTWTTISMVPSTFGPLVNAAFSTVWTIPHWTTTNALVRISVTDLAGNSGSATSGNLTIDNYFPTASLSAIPSALKGGSSLDLTLSATAVSGTLSTVDLEYAADGSSFTTVSSWTPGTATWNATYTWNVPTDNTTTAKIRLVVTNTFPASSTASSSVFAVDSIVPQFTVGQFKINGGSASTSINSLKITLKASDNLTNITHFCLKQNSVAPAGNDSCWKSVSGTPPGLSPSINLNLNNYPYLIGFNPGSYTVYAWVKDAAGNISDLSNAGTGTDGTDKGTITYQPPVAPTVLNVVSSARDAIGSPLDQTLDLTTPASSSVFVKWKATDNAALPSNAVSISYTLDGVTYTSLTSNLPNSAGGGCMVDGVTYTGCVVIPSPTSAAYSIRVTVLDSENQTTSASAPPMNTKPLNIIAGNTDPGFGGSATSAVIFQIGQGMSTIPNALAVSASGKFFIIEQRGLIVIDPADGLYKKFIPITGSTTDGDISTATLKGPSQIAMDYEDRLLIYDSDRIRRVDLTTNTISTVVGGGGSTADGVSAASFAASAPGGSGLFVPLPNGDIWFQLSSENWTYRNGTSKLRVYKASLDKVFEWVPTGVGSAEDPGYDPSGYVTEFYGIRFDPSTSALNKVVSRSSIPTSGGKNNRSTSYDPVTMAAAAPHVVFPGYWGGEGVINGRSGEMYTGNRFESHGIFKFDGTSGWNRILGTGGQGQCADGTAATSCPVDLYTFYVGENDQIYFIDRGRVRTIDSNGNVLTLFGQSKSFGDGGIPESARFNSILWIDRIDDGRIVVKDENEIRFREFTIGGTISTIAGNGYSAGPDTSSAANAQSIYANYWGGNFPFVTNPANGDLFYTRDSSVLSILDRSTGRWRDFAGTGGTSDLNADGMTGDQIAIQGYGSGPLGFNGSQVIRNRHNWNGTYQENGMLKLYQISDGTQAHFAGVGGGAPADTNLQDCADGSPVASCKVEQNFNAFTRFGWDSVSGRWLFAHLGSSKIQAAAEGGTVSTFYNAPTGMNSFTYVTKGTDHYLYYCSTSNYHIRRYHVETSSDIELPWPNNTITCSGWSMNWDPVRKTVIFPISQNGLMGIGEYNDP